MAAGTDATIYEALCKHLIDLNAGFDIAFPGVDYPQPGQTKAANYLRVDFIPNTTTNSELGAGQEQHRGIFQVSIYWKAGVAVIDPLETAQTIINHFHKGTTLYEAGLKIQISRKPYLASPFPDDGRMKTPITIQYQAFS